MEVYLHPTGGGGERGRGRKERVKFSHKTNDSIIYCWYKKYRLSFFLQNTPCNAQMNVLHSSTYSCGDPKLVWCVEL